MGGADMFGLWCQRCNNTHRSPVWRAPFLCGRCQDKAATHNRYFPLGSTVVTSD